MGRICFFDIPSTLLYIALLAHREHQPNHVLSPGFLLWVVVMLWSVFREIFSVTVEQTVLRLFLIRDRIIKLPSNLIVLSSVKLSSVLITACTITICFSISSWIPASDYFCVVGRAAADVICVAQYNCLLNFLFFLRNVHGNKCMCKLFLCV